MKNKLAQNTFFTLACFLFASQNAIATNVTAKISDIHVFQNDRVGVNLQGFDKTSLNNSPSSTGGCTITQNRGNFVIELGTDTGDAQFALLLSAEAQGKEVYISGRNVCIGGREQINFVQILNQG